MQMRIGVTSIDFQHENGSLLAEIAGLCACFGLTRPELEDLFAKMPAALPCREGYVPLGAFLTACSQLLRESMTLCEEGALSREQLRELELRTHNYILLVGALSQDLLGSCQSLPAISSAPGPQVQPLTAGELHTELASFTQTLKSMARICLELFDSLETMTDASRPPSSLFGTATSLLDMIHTACWEYTRWYSLYQASCPRDTTAGTGGSESARSETVPSADASSTSS